MVIREVTQEELLSIGYHAGIIALIIIFTVLLAKAVRKVMNHRDHFISYDSSQYKFLSHFVSAGIYFMGMVSIVYSIPSIRGAATAVFASSGVFAIIIGFASKQAFANIVGGVFIAIFKPFRVGDRLRLVDKNFVGIVEDITLRHTVIRTFEYKRIIIPNSVISSETLENENLVEDKILRFWEIGVAYSTDIDKAKRIIREEVLKHPFFYDNRSEDDISKGVEAVKIRLISFEESALLLRAYVWVENPGNAFQIGCDLNESIKKRFDEEGVQIPFPCRNVYLDRSI